MRMKYINEKPWALKAGNAKNMADRAEPACSSLYEAAKHQLLPAGLELAPLAVAHQIAWPEPQRLAERSRKGSRIGISRLQGRLQNGQLTVADAGCCQSQPVAAHIADRSRSENGKEVTLQLPRRRIKRACRGKRYLPCLPARQADSREHDWLGGSSPYWQSVACPKRIAQAPARAVEARIPSRSSLPFGE